MGKKTILRHETKPIFRESDFAGRPPQEQAELSGSLNQLSQQLVASRQLLQSLVPMQALAPRAPDGEAAQPQPSDDDTAVPQ